MTKAALLTLAGLLIVVCGCSVEQAATAPSYKDTTVLEPGVLRTKVIETLGQPCRTYQDAGGSKDVFQVSGASASGGEKAVRSSLNFISDVSTFGAAELFQSSEETERKRQCTTFTITYTPSNEVKTVQLQHWRVEGVCGDGFNAPACGGGGNTANDGTQSKTAAAIVPATVQEGNSAF